jgi:hypothetical protein
MHRGQWGGDRAVLLAQARMYRALHLGEFLGKEGKELASSSQIDNTAYLLPDDAGEVLAGVLSAGGQSAEIALLNAGVLERLDPIGAVAATVAAALVPPPAPAPPTNHHKRPRKTG